MFEKLARSRPTSNTTSPYGPLCAAPPHQTRLPVRPSYSGATTCAAVGSGIGNDGPTDRADRPKRAAADSLNGVKEGQTEFLTLQSERRVRSGGTRAWREGQLGLRSQNETTRNPTPPPIAGMVRSLSRPPSVRRAAPCAQIAIGATPPRPPRQCRWTPQEARCGVASKRPVIREEWREREGGDDGATPPTSGDSDGASEGLIRQTDTHGGSALAPSWSLLSGDLSPGQRAYRRNRSRTKIMRL